MCCLLLDLNAEFDASVLLHSVMNTKPGTVNAVVFFIRTSGCAGSQQLIIHTFCSKHPIFHTNKAAAAKPGSSNYSIDILLDAYQ